jgi:hypothetical protein
MLTHPSRILLKNKTFRAMLLLGTAATIVSIILNIVSTASAYSCVSDDYCFYNDYNKHIFTCVQGG